MDGTILTGLPYWMEKQIFLWGIGLLAVFWVSRWSLKNKIKYLKEQLVKSNEEIERLTESPISFERWQQHESLLIEKDDNIARLTKKVQDVEKARRERAESTQPLLKPFQGEAKPSHYVSKKPIGHGSILELP